MRLTNACSDGHLCAADGVGVSQQRVFWQGREDWHRPCAVGQHQLLCAVFPRVIRLIADHLSADFAVEIWSSIVFFVAYALNKPGTRSPTNQNGADFGDAFNLKGGAQPRNPANGKPNAARTPPPMRQTGRTPRDIENGEIDSASRPLYPPQERERAWRAAPPSSFNPNANANGRVSPAPSQGRMSRDGVVYGQAV